VLHRIRHLAFHCKPAAGGTRRSPLLAAMVLVTMGLGNALASDTNSDRLGGWLFAEAHLEALKDALERAAEAINRGGEADALVILQPFIDDQRLAPVELAEVQTWLGYLLLRRGQTALAETFFRRAAAADPERVAAWTGLGDVRVHRRAFAEARGHYAKAAAVE
jgi:tetratricopeptide (TPR) repeat protein